MTNLSPNDHLELFSNTTKVISETTVSAAIAKVLEAGANVTIVTNTDGTITITPTFSGLSAIYVDGITIAGVGTSASPMHMIGLPSNITISPAIIAPLTYGTYFSQQLSEGGGSGAVSYAVTTGSLPSGLILTTSGLLSGTPTAIGLYNFIITATDSVGIKGQHSYSVPVAPVALVLSPSLLPNAFVGALYSNKLSASGGTGSYTYSLTSGSLPTGVSLSGDTISGMPSAVSSTYFTIKATDVAGNYGTRNYTLAVTGQVVISPLALNSGAAASFYSQHITATGGSNSGFIFTVASGALPAGLTLSPTGLISGQATTMGTSAFTINVTDSLGNVGSQSYSITINNSLSLAPSSLPDGSISTSYSQPVTASGGSGGGYVFTVLTGALPPGFSLINGIISGAPTIAGKYSFVIKVVDSDGSYLSKSYSININTVTLALSDLISMSGIKGTPFSQMVYANGGTGSYTNYWISAGTLPPGLSFSGNTISGTPTNTGTYSFSISVVDSAGDTGVNTYSINIAA